MDNFEKVKIAPNCSKWCKMTLESGPEWFWRFLKYSKCLFNLYHAEYVNLRFKKADLPTLHRLAIAPNHCIYSQIALVVLESWVSQLSNSTKRFGYKWFLDPKSLIEVFFLA